MKVRMTVLNGCVPQSHNAHDSTRERGGIYRKETWSVAVVGHKGFNNTPVGHSNEVTWKLREGDFTWLKMEVTEIHPVQ